MTAVLAPITMLASNDFASSWSMASAHCDQTMDRRDGGTPTRARTRLKETVTEEMRFVIVENNLADNLEGEVLHALAGDVWAQVLLRRKKFSPPACLGRLCGRETHAPLCDRVAEQVVHSKAHAIQNFIAAWRTTDARGEWNELSFLGHCNFKSPMPWRNIQFFFS